MKAIHFQKLLASEQYDIILVNETWLEQCFNTINKNYKIIQSNGTKGYRGTLIAIKNKFVFHSIETKYENLSLCKVILEQGKHIILGSYYLPPNHADWIASKDILNETLNEFEKRYDSFSLLLYADANIDLRKKCNQAKLLPNNKGFNFHYDENLEAFTHSQVVNQIMKKSYLDFFISKNVTLSNTMSNNKCFPGSDHSLISALITDSVFIRSSIKKLTNQKQIKSLKYEIRNLFIQLLKGNEKLSNFNKFISQIQSWHKPIFIKYRPFKLENCPVLLNDLEELQEVELSRMIRS